MKFGVCIAKFAIKISPTTRTHISHGVPAKAADNAGEPKYASKDSE